MTEAADIIRDKRRLWAAPGGSHDCKVHVLARWLPGLVGVVAAAMIVGPLFTEGELSFLLDRNKVAVTQERLRVNNAMYRGEDKRGRPFTVTAGSAVQVTSTVPVVQMENLAARIRLSDGPAELTAVRGKYDYSAQTVAVEGPVVFTAADGYRLTTQNVSIDLRSRSVMGSGGVSGAIPSGTFSAERISADLDNRVLMLDGNVRMRFVQTSFRMPQ
ncbi:MULTISPECIES: LPS export ABC transporter periplasmic protein LptC [unclassified Novosphingobium]|uniref:LPS export ABC transporter periplasmic protein LptC n=1 Tax=unclassified Novosphingobium TaxID=2644732 RepID=UPI000EBE35A1|nr:MULTISPECIES: LPS export ABC transporter periplasmic protein LptC [unclassified Novosphingobium]HCF25459.1 LPS export ABC transporter periplasmic protein LptC [Novosphingobium sp.]HQV04279.1 LPS export ABC transporter periplasmic protein LptC [Novosphingobium sp.]